MQAALVAAPLILGSCSATSCIDKEYEGRNFLHLSKIAATYPEFGAAVCHISREQGETQLREISRSRDGYQDWIFIERAEGCLWTNLFAEYKSINALGYRLFSYREIKSLNLLRKQDIVTHYVTCPDTGKDIDSYSLKANLPSPKNFLDSKSVKDAVERKRAVFRRSISISPHIRCEFGNTGNYTSEQRIATILYDSLYNIFFNNDTIRDSQFPEFRASLEEKGLFLRVKRHQDNKQR